MPGPSSHPPEGRDIGCCRRDQPRRDGINVVRRREAKPSNQSLNRGINHGCGDMLISLYAGSHNGQERAPFGVKLPLPEDLDGELLRLRVDGLATFLA
jgi:hypothetical protein